MTISATVLADSITEDGERIVSFELVYPRIIHAELLTHRIFSKNSASSRAIPVKKMNDLIMEDVAKPWRFGKANKGMQDAGEHDALVLITGPDGEKNIFTAEGTWEYAAGLMVDISNAFDKAGYAKQVCNRLTEPFQHMKVVLTSTSFDNFLHLRIHTDADPTIHMLAVTILEALKSSKPRLLLEGEWHVPYYQDGYWSDTGTGEDMYGNTLDHALKISVSQCAQVSFRNIDDTIEKARSIYDRLMGSDPKHSSPTEHQATPLIIPDDKRNDWYKVEGVTHLDRDGHFWSGNFRGWIQHRQLIPGHDCKKYDFGG